MTKRERNSVVAGWGDFGTILLCGIKFSLRDEDGGMILC